MVNALVYGLVAALGAHGAIASPIAEANSPSTYKPESWQPSWQPSCKNKTSVDANFDDLTGLPGIIFNTIPTPYDGLDYSGIDFTTVISTGDNTLQPGIRPHSGLNYAAINVVSQLSGTPTLTKYYPGSTIESFELESFYFGCVIQLGQGAAALPSACNVEITGYKGSDNSIANAQQVCSQQFQYQPTTALATVEQAYSGPINKDCTGLDFAVITFSLPGGESALGLLSALVLDDIKYTTCST